ncbi:Uncharacterised protein [uncultured archaeon]|nr:Uncharacterised protein [uncultured archaeon]
MSGHGGGRGPRTTFGNMWGEFANDFGPQKMLHGILREHGPIGQPLRLAEKWINPFGLANIALNARKKANLLKQFARQNEAAHRIGPDARILAAAAGRLPESRFFHAYEHTPPIQSMYVAARYQSEAANALIRKYRADEKKAKAEGREMPKTRLSAEHLGFLKHYAEERANFISEFAALDAMMKKAAMEGNTKLMKQASSEYKALAEKARGFAEFERKHKASLLQLEKEWAKIGNEELDALKFTSGTPKV